MDHETKNFLADVVGVIEANSFEYSQLWMMHAENAKTFGNFPDYYKISWEENLTGLLETVGHVAGLPVCISLRTVMVDGRKILFYDPTSRIVDHDMIREWLVKNLPKSAFRGMNVINHSDAMNSSNILKG